MIIDDILFVHYISLPHRVRGAVVPNSDGTFDVYINAVLDDENRKKAIQHEVDHIKKEHLFRDEISVCECEKSAERSCEHGKLRKA